MNPHPSMNLQQYYLIFRAHWKLALCVMLVIVGIAVPVILLLPKQYTATTSLAVDIRSPDPITMLLMPTHMASQEEIIKSERVTQNVIKMVKLDEDPALQRRWREVTAERGRFEVWLADELHKRLSILPARAGGNVITIAYKSPDPRRAAAVANAFAQIYVEAVVEMKVEPAKQYARGFGDQRKALRESLEAAQARLSAFQQRRGIGIRDETLEGETARLAQLMSQLTSVQAEAVDARSKQRAGSADALPEMAKNSVIQGLRGEIARTEAKLKEAGGNLGKNHPQYRSMEAELAEMKVRLAAETRHVASSFSAARSVSADKENELKAAIEAQRKKLLALRGERDELAVLQRDVEAAKHAYDTAEKRYTQTHLESQATQTNVFVLQPAVEPLWPSFPKIPHYTLAAVLFGMLLGAAAAHLREMLDRRVRCIDDIAGLLQIPVLSVVERGAIRGPLALQRRNAPIALLK